MFKYTITLVALSVVKLKLLVIGYSVVLESNTVYSSLLDAPVEAYQRSKKAATLIYHY